MSEMEPQVGPGDETPINPDEPNSVLGGQEPSSSSDSYLEDDPFKVDGSIQTPLQVDSTTQEPPLEQEVSGPDVFAREKFKTAITLDGLVDAANLVLEERGPNALTDEEIRESLKTFVNSVRPVDPKDGSRLDLFDINSDYRIPDFGGLRQRVIDLRAQCLAGAHLSEEAASALREEIQSARTVDDVINILNQNDAIPDTTGTFYSRALDWGTKVLKDAVRTGAITDVQLSRSLPNFALLDKKTLEILSGATPTIMAEREEAQIREAAEKEELTRTETMREAKQAVTARLSAVNSFTELLYVLNSDDIKKLADDFQQAREQNPNQEGNDITISVQAPQVLNELGTVLGRNPLDDPNRYSSEPGVILFNLLPVIERLRLNLDLRLSSCLNPAELGDALTLGPESQLQVTLSNNNVQTLGELGAKLKSDDTIDESQLPDLIAKHCRRVTSSAAFEVIKIKRHAGDGTERPVPCDASEYSRLVTRVAAAKSLDDLVLVLTDRGMPDFYSIDGEDVTSHEISSVVSRINISATTYKRMSSDPRAAEKREHLLRDLVMSVSVLLDKLPPIAGIKDKARSLLYGFLPETEGRFENRQVDINGFSIKLNGSENAQLLNRPTVDGRALVSRDQMDNQVLSIIGQQIDLSEVRYLDTLPRQYIEGIGEVVIIQSEPNKGRLVVCNPNDNFWTIRAINSDGQPIQPGEIPQRPAAEEPAELNMEEQEQRNARFFVEALRQSLHITSPEEQKLFDRLLSDESINDIDRQVILAELGIITEDATPEKYEAAATLLDTIRRDAEKQISPANNRRLGVRINKSLQQLASTINVVRTLGIEKKINGMSARWQIPSRILVGMASSVLTRSALIVALSAGLAMPAAVSVAGLAVVGASGIVVSAREVLKEQEAWAQREKGWRERLKDGFRGAGNLMKALVGKPVGEDGRETVEQYGEYLKTLDTEELLRRLAEARLKLSTQEVSEGGESERHRQDLIERYGKLIEATIRKCGEDGVDGAISSTQEILDKTTHLRTLTRGIGRGLTYTALSFGAGRVLRSVFHMGQAPEHAAPTTGGNDQVPPPPQVVVPAESPAASTLTGGHLQIASEEKVNNAVTGAGQLGAAGLHHMSNPTETVSRPEEVSGLGDLQPSFITEKATEWVSGGEPSGEISLVDQSIAAHEIRANIAERLNLWDQHADGTGSLKGDWVTRIETTADGRHISVQTLRAPITLNGGITIQPGEVKITNGEFDFSALKSRTDVMGLISSERVWTSNWADHRLGQISAKLENVDYVARMTGYSAETLSANNGQLLHHVQDEAKAAFSGYFKEGKPTMMIGDSQLVPKPHSTNEFLQSNALRSALRQEVASYAQRQGIQIIETPKVAPARSGGYNGFGGGRTTVNRAAGVEYSGWGEKNPPAPYVGDHVPKISVDPQIAVDQTPTSADHETSIGAVTDAAPEPEHVEPVTSHGTSTIDRIADTPTKTIQTEGPAPNVEEEIKVDTAEEPIKVEIATPPKDSPQPVVEPALSHNSAIERLKRSTSGYIEKAKIKVKQEGGDPSQFEDITVGGLDQK